MNQDTLEILILDLIDGSISTENFAALENELRTNPQAVETYVALSRVENLLHVSSEIKSYEIKSVVPMESILKRQRSKTIKLVLLSTAALILVGIMLMNVFFVKNNEPPLTFKIAPHTEYSISHRSDKEVGEGLILKKGSRLVIHQGTVELTFKSGVKSIVSAPAELTLTSDEHISLNEGSAWFEVPADAIGFQVTTKNVNVVDLGTEFGVHSRSDGADEIHVFKGKVQSRALRFRKESATLTAGESRLVDPVGRLITIPIKANAFLTSLPKSLPHLHWSFDGDQPFKPEGTLPEIDTITTHPIQSDSRPATKRLVSGKNGAALSFNGKGDHMKTNWMGILGREPRSVACWIKIHPNDLNGWAPIVEWGHMSDFNYWRFRVTQDETDPKRAVLRLGFGRSWYDGQSNLADGKWHHVAVVDTGKLNELGTPNIKFFVDGEEEAAIHQKDSKVMQYRDTIEGEPMIMGIHHESLESPYIARLHGVIDELFIFRATLSPTHIQEIMQTHQP